MEIAVISAFAVIFAVNLIIVGVLFYDHFSGY